ncbi:MAG: NifB/NifX family molybdenum-iron cluster-binding protein [Gemmatimonadales bacterium]|jgi:predicted Fe-Mo cluster-binding NifX family protein
MRLCIPTDDDRGLAGRLSSHFGSAPYFTLVESETGEVQVIGNLHSEHEPGACVSADALRGYGVEAVVVRGLGRRAFSRMRTLGLPVYVAEEGEASTALEAFRAGRLGRMTAESACHGGQGHGRHHRHHHEDE